MERLSKREVDIVLLVGKGLRNRQIGTTLGITEGTVRNILHGAFVKLGVRSRTELVLLLFERAA